MPAFDIKDIERRMEGALAALKADLGGLRTGRATSALLEPVMVEAYGSMVPLTQVGSISAPEPRMLTVSVWDRGLSGAVDKAIRASGLGLNPIAEGQSIRVPIPPLTAERRTELAKTAGKYAEQARVALRNVRRDGMDLLKKLEKNGELGQDEVKALEAKLQTVTDGFVKKVDESLKAKEVEIMQV